MQESGYDFSGVHKPTNDKDNYSLAYAEFTVPLVKAVQEQQKVIEALQKQLTDQIKHNGELKAELTQKENTMNARLETLEALMQKGKVSLR